MLKIKDIKFIEQDGKVKVTVYNLFYKEFNKEELDEIGDYQIKENRISIGNLDDDAASKRFMRFFRRHKTELQFSLNGNKAVYVDEDLGLPLIGLNFLGIVDKGSEMIEVKPITNCNADCSFCSVNEGCSSNKQADFVVDVDYLIAETVKLLEFKGTPVSIWINPHGEPTLYAKLALYCDEMLSHELVSDIHIVTNGVLFNSPLTDCLSDIAERYGKEIKISVSMSGVGVERQEKSKHNKNGFMTSKLMMGSGYNIDVVLKNLNYAKERLPVMITPVWVNGMNDDDIKKLALLGKKLGLEVSIQKFCKNKRGRNPAPEISWDEFFENMKKLEEETGVKLLKPLGKIKETKELPMVCRKGDKVQVQVLCGGRYLNERIGALDGRAISLIGCSKDKGTIKATILQAKHNLYLGKC
ncbi:radical SAM protein [Candidatus Woesearchaeota archaeon]|nr:radical SAM protein [Candidatus Woesearchaeota archaeon]